MLPPPESPRLPVRCWPSLHCSMRACTATTRRREPVRRSSTRPSAHERAKVRNSSLRQVLNLQQLQASLPQRAELAAGCDCRNWKFRSLQQLLASFLRKVRAAPPRRASLGRRRRLCITADAGVASGAMLCVAARCCWSYAGDASASGGAGMGASTAACSTTASRRCSLDRAKA